MKLENEVAKLSQAKCRQRGCACEASNIREVDKLFGMATGQNGKISVHTLCRQCRKAQLQADKYKIN